MGFGAQQNPSGRACPLAVEEPEGGIDNTLAADVHPLLLVEEEYRLALLDAESAFVERFIEQITHPETGWGRLWAEFHGDAAAPDKRQTP